MDGDTTASDFGNIIHGIAENYTGNGKEEILRIYKHLLKAYNIKIENEDYKKRLPLAFKNVHACWKAHLKHTKQENCFQEDDITVSVNESYGLNGKIDLIVLQDDGMVRIIDYKTSKSTKYAKFENQLATYMYLVHRKYEIPYEKMICEIDYLALMPEEKDGTPVINTGYDNISKICPVDESDVCVLLEEIEHIHHRILRSEKKNTWRASPTWFNCNFCPFNSLCEDRHESVSLQ
jgi:RecB family exonuclease